MCAFINQRDGKFLNPRLFDLSAYQNALNFLRLYELIDPLFERSAASQVITAPLDRKVVVAFPRVSLPGETQDLFSTNFGRSYSMLSVKRGLIRLPTS
jgi:hypothetical protein